MKKIVLTLSVVLSCIMSLTLQAQEPCVTAFTDGSFSVGVKVTFETLESGTDVKASFELLDTDKEAELGFIRDAGEPINQMEMTKESKNSFSIILPNQTDGETISRRFYMVIVGGGDRLTQPVDYVVGSDCSGTNDTVAPSGFTAELGEVTAFSVEFLVNAMDDSGTVAYYVTYNGMTNAISAPSNTPSSLVVSGLNADTEYNFSVVATDLSGNGATPIDLTATTALDASTPCEGSSSDALDGQFNVGYNYTFETLPSGTDVVITFELLDQGRGLADTFLWRAPPPLGPGFVESPMSLVSGQKYTATVSGLTPGEQIYYSCKFVVAGGALVPQYLEYTVGDDCSLSVNDLDLAAFKLYPNPTNDTWTVSTKDIKMTSVQIVDILGKNVMTLAPNTTTVLIDASALKAGVYFAKIKTQSGISSLKLVKK